MIEHRHWVEMMDGSAFDLLSDDPQFNIDDLIWGCARQPRYGGQFSSGITWYSVAEHCCHIFDYLAERCAPRPPRVALMGALLHDLAEGVLGDMPTPLKALCPDFEAIDTRVSKAIARRYGCPWPWHPLVKETDMRILLDEVAQVKLPRDRRDWGLPADLQPLGVKLQCWDPQTAAMQMGWRLRSIGIENGV